MDVVVKSRNCDVTDRFREHVEEKLGRLEKHDHRVIRIEVELDKERNPRLQERAIRVELTAFSKGPVIRAEAAAEDKLAALDLALDKMAAQMRRAADRKKVHHGRRTPVSVAQALSGLEPAGDAVLGQTHGAASLNGVEAATSLDATGTGSVAVTGDGPLVVREKAHAARPMSLEQALYEMELVGHDFFLYVDRDSSCPSVVYRRKGYDYGLLSLTVEPD